ncbi:MAG TPA: endonuclease/exonuclease/phosphatase family protein, partial [Salinimicrobium sp.]|nr:endonuclease/exonuclease/phosphatase family protein [Salinimicrobium sp.]
MMIVAKMAKKDELPVIVTGDFNDVAWSETTSLFQEVSGLLDPRIGRGFFNTYNANSFIMRWPLDHLFISREWRLVDLERGSDFGSDHFPIYFKLSLEPENAPEQEKKNPSAEEKKEAAKAIKAAK